jgi:hypothetical protein
MFVLQLWYVKILNKKSLSFHAMVLHLFFFLESSSAICFFVLLPENFPFLLLYFFFIKKAS